MIRRFEKYPEKLIAGGMMDKDDRINPLDYLSPYDREYLQKIWERYHDSKLNDLPSEVYFDFGWLHALVFKLAEQIHAANHPPLFEDPKD